MRPASARWIFSSTIGLTFVICRYFGNEYYAESFASLRPQRQVQSSSGEPSPTPAVAKSLKTVREDSDMARLNSSLSPEERARVLEIQDCLIERLVERNEAVADGQEDRASKLQEEINDLFGEKEEIEKWSAAG